MNSYKIKYVDGIEMGDWWTRYIWKIKNCVWCGREMINNDYHTMPIDVCEACINKSFNNTRQKYGDL